MIASNRPTDIAQSSSGQSRETTAKRSYNPDFRSSSFSRHGAPPKKAH